MMLAYFCAGYGYVVSATFIVDIVEGLNSLQGWGQYIFIVVGASAIPAVMLWDLVARRYGCSRCIYLGLTRTSATGRQRHVTGLILH